jgi:hypothetical protein
MDDPEIKAMQTISAALSELEDEDGRRRVLDWASRRYGGQPLPGASRSAQIGPLSGDQQEFTDFADLLSAANPRTDVERALVGGYWFQVVRGNPGFNAQEVNGELKNTGHSIRNITDAFGGLIARRPQFALQVAKTGRSRQARKTYKLTTAGIGAVRQMMQRAENEEE